MTKMQLIATFQVELAYKQLMFQPESRALINNLDAFSSTAGAMKTLLEELPGQVAGERAALVGDVSRLLEQERTAVTAMLNSPETQALFSQVNTTLEKMDQNTRRLNQGLAAADKVLQKGGETGIVLTEFVQTLDRFADKFGLGNARPGEKTFDINEYTRAMAQLEKSTDKLQQLVQSISRANDTLALSLVDSMNTAAKTQVDHLFIRLVQLCLIAGLVVFGLILAGKFIGRRQTP